MTSTNTESKIGKTVSVIIVAFFGAAFTFFFQQIPSCSSWPDSVGTQANEGDRDFSKVNVFPGYFYRTKNPNTILFVKEADRVPNTSNDWFAEIEIVIPGHKRFEMKVDHNASWLFNHKDKSYRLNGTVVSDDGIFFKVDLESID